MHDTPRPMHQALAAVLPTCCTAQVFGEEEVLLDQIQGMDLRRAHLPLIVAKGLTEAHWRRFADHFRDMLDEDPMIPPEVRCTAGACTAEYPVLEVWSVAGCSGHRTWHGRHGSTSHGISAIAALQTGWTRAAPRRGAVCRRC